MHINVIYKSCNITHTLYQNLSSKHASLLNIFVFMHHMNFNDKNLREKLVYYIADDAKNIFLSKILRKGSKKNSFIYFAI